MATVPESASIGFTGLTTNSFLVFWTPHSDGGSPITGYHLLIKNQDTGQTITELNTSYNTTSTLIQNLDSGTNYKAYVIVINAIGNSFEQSYSVKTLVAGEPPEQRALNAVVLGENTVRLRWNTSTQQAIVTGYEIKVRNDLGQIIREKTVLPSTATGNYNEYIVTGLSIASNYTASLIVKSNVGDSPQSNVYFKTLGTIIEPVIISSEVQIILNKFEY